jgi:hypothetical protein
MQYTEFTELYPFLNTRLIEWASARIAGTSEYLESEVRSQISLLNWKMNDRRINLPGNKQLLLEFPDGLLVAGIDAIAMQDEEFRYLSEQLAEAKASLRDIKATTVTPTKAQTQQAVAEVKEYIEALGTPSVNTFLQWNQRLSGKEKFFIQNLPTMLRSSNTAETDEDNLGRIWNVAYREWGYLDGGYTALAEPVSHSFFEGDQLIAAITTNSYGVKVLNAPTVMFVDIDFDTEETPVECLPWETQGKGLKEQIIEIKRSLARATKAWGLHLQVYRTFNGLRLIELSREWNPNSPESTTVLEAVGCDRLFQQLCKTQGTFRARLQPKPWRESTNCHSVCHTFGGYGSAPVNPIAARVKVIHDSWCLGINDLA